MCFIIENMWYGEITLVENGYKILINGICLYIATRSPFNEYTLVPCDVIKPVEFLEIYRFVCCSFDGI